MRRVDFEWGQTRDNKTFLLVDQNSSNLFRWPN